MKLPPYRAMVAALRLTRAGHLGDATALLQRTLRGGEAPTLPVVTEPVRDPVTTREPIAGARPASRSNGAPMSRQTLLEKQRGRFLPLSFTNEAGTRAYKLFVPGNYNGQPCPLIVMLHGCTQSPDDFAAGTHMNVLADELTYFVAYPEQPASANPSKCWNWFKQRDQQRDRGEPSIVAGITRRIMQDYAIDRKRVYVAGMSAGAAAAAVLGAAYPDLYAALGVHSGLATGLAHDVPSALAAMRNGTGGRPRGVERRGTEKRSLPTIVFHGDRDATVHPSNGDRFAADLAVLDGERRVERGLVPGGRAYTRTTQSDPSGQSVLEQWVIHGAGHAWSGGSESGSYTDPQGPDASREIVRFFLAHQHPD